jgi:mannobiose 2-epimerase
MALVALCCRHDGSDVGAASPTSPNKVWWSQAEALLGFDWLHKQTGKASNKARLTQTLNFIKTHLLDKRDGEWYWQTGPTGGAPLAFNAGGVNFAPTVKGNAWKASYHTGRALLRLAQAGY